MEDESALVEDDLVHGDDEFGPLPSPSSWLPPQRSQAPEGSPDSDSSVEGSSPDAAQAASLETAGPPAASPSVSAQEVMRSLERVTAEYANYRRRAAAELEAARSVGATSVVFSLLEALDDMGLAAEHGDLTGVFLSTSQKVVSALRLHGLERFGAPGDLFDPLFHDAVSFVGDASASVFVVSTVVQYGYAVSGEVIRPARVIVSPAP